MRSTNVYSSQMAWMQSVQQYFYGINYRINIILTTKTGVVTANSYWTKQP